MYQNSKQFIKYKLPWIIWLRSGQKTSRNAILLLINFYWRFCLFGSHGYGHSLFLSQTNKTHEISAIHDSGKNCFTAEEKEFLSGQKCLIQFDFQVLHFALKWLLHKKTACGESAKCLSAKLQVASGRRKSSLYILLDLVAQKHECTNILHNMSCKVTIWKHRTMLH